MLASVSPAARKGLIAGCTTLGVVGLHAGAALFFASHDPYSTTIFPQCPILALTGWQCPGCGGTRATYSLFHGDVVQSLRMNPLVIAGYAAGALVAGTIAAEWTGRHHRLGRILSRAAIVLVAAVGVYSAIIRNLLGL
jgi:fermentation-respiration switch protein FrsA (DUF1100 family)